MKAAFYFLCTECGGWSVVPQTKDNLRGLGATVTNGRRRGSVAGLVTKLLHR